MRRSASSSTEQGAGSRGAAYRFYEMVPALTAWSTLLALVAASWLLPGAVVVFIVLYDLYWLLKVVYLFTHLIVSFRELRKNLGVAWTERLRDEYGGRWEDIHHLVIYPFYRESAEVVRASLSALADSSYPRERVLVVLASEARGGAEDAAVAEAARAEFEGRFGGFLVATHPADIPGELPGKGSNETWAAREAVRTLVDARGIPHERVLVSVFDIDTRVPEGYLGILTYRFLGAPRPLRTSYQPTPVFSNNFSGVPVFARLIGLSATFWQLMQQGRPEQLVTFSSHSMPLSALIAVGFWDTTIVSEDSRIFFQCLVHYKGDWRSEPLIYPVYMDAVEGTGFWDSLKNLYKQQRRWAWGVENFPYLVHAFKTHRDIPRRVRRFWFWRTFDGFYSWATSSFVIFLFGVFPNVVGGDAFRTTVLSYNLPRITGWLINLSSLGIITSAFLSLFIIPAYRSLFASGRHRGRGLVKAAWALVQWALMPLTFIVFGSIPALEAQTRAALGGRFRLGFWRTPKATARPAES